MLSPEAQIPGKRTLKLPQGVGVISTVGTSEPKPRPGYKAAGEGHCASAAGKGLLCNLEAAQVIRRHNYQHFF